MRRNTFLGSLLGLALLLPVGCREEGEVEKLGRQIDEALEQVEEDAEDLGDEIEKKAKELEDKYD